MIVLKLIEAKHMRFFAIVEVEALPVPGDRLSVANGDAVVQVEVIDKLRTTINLGTMFAANEEWALCRVIDV